MMTSRAIYTENDDVMAKVSEALHATFRHFWWGPGATSSLEILGLLHVRTVRKSFAL